MQINRFMGLIESIFSCETDPKRKSDYIGKWTVVNIDRSIFSADCVNRKNYKTPLYVYSSFRFHSVVQCLLGRDKTCKVITCTRMPCAKESTMNDMENVTKKNKNKVHTQTTINYLVISLQAANKFNQCKGLAVRFIYFNKRMNCMRTRPHLFSDYMCSF